MLIITPRCWWRILIESFAGMENRWKYVNIFYTGTSTCSFDGLLQRLFLFADFYLLRACWTIKQRTVNNNINTEHSSLSFTCPHLLHTLLLFICSPWYRCPFILHWRHRLPSPCLFSHNKLFTWPPNSRPTLVMLLPPSRCLCIHETSLLLSVSPHELVNRDSGKGVTKEQIGERIGNYL